MQIGPYNIYQVVTHDFALDGGAMFGVVPKTLWSKLIPADERNRIPMVSRILLLVSDNAKVLIDLGCGDKFNSKLADIYAVERRTKAPLHSLLPDITHVLITHLHFDHVGGVSHLDEKGEPQLSFPNACHVLSRVHWEYSKSPSARERASFFPDNLQPLAGANRQLVEDGAEVLEGIRIHLTHGHTHGMYWLEITDGQRTLVYPSDLMPTAHHIALPYIMGYDLCAETTLREKEAFLNKAIENNWIVVFEHDRDHVAGELEFSDGRPVLARTVALPCYPGTESQ